ncbi:MAG: acyl-CoA desaturase [Chloroflexi bacterium]|nr:acyl-CoA desaturase [Chloroflexota bacterium]
MQGTVSNHPGGTYAEIKRIIEAEGLLTLQPLYYWFKFITTGAALGVGVWLALYLDNTALLLLTALYLGLVFGQIETLGHDVGHLQVIRGRRRLMNLTGVIFGNLFMAFSYTHWIAKHNRHHAYPNHLKLDPDIQYPILSLSAQDVSTRTGPIRFIIAYQAFFFLLFIPFQPIGQRVGSIIHIAGGGPRYTAAEAIATLVHFGVYSYILFQFGSWPLAIAFVAVHQGTLGIFNGLVFTPNHAGMPLVTDETRMDFLHEQIETARNIRGGLVADFMYGGLNYQIEHHLFPTMPRNNLHRAQPIVAEFCKKESIPYHETTVWGAYRELFGFLHRVSAPLRRSAHG